MMEPIEIGSPGGYACLRIAEFLQPLRLREYFPYRCSSFKNIRREKKCWRDNGQNIAATVERMEEHIMFVRPPRWGKSLFLDMLKCYLYIKEENNFDTLLNGTDIYSMRNQLRCKNQYYVMHFNLSIEVDDNGGVAAMKQCLRERYKMKSPHSANVMVSTSSRRLETAL